MASFKSHSDRKREKVDTRLPEKKEGVDPE